MRRVLAALIVVGLAVGVVLLWPRATTEEAPTTLAAPTTTASTSTTTPSTSTTTTVPDSTTTTADSHVVETVEEAEAILRSHYYRWFKGIYEEDEELIRSLVVLDAQYEAATGQFGTMEFESAPSVDGLQFEDVEILRSDDQCLALWSVASASFRAGSSAGVTLFRWVDSEWKLLSSWQSRNDLWETDCESSLSP